MKRFPGLLGLSLLLFPAAAQAQNFEIIAGISTGDLTLSADGRPAASTRLSFPRAAAIGPDGLVYIAAGEGVRRIGADGLITTVVRDPQISTFTQLAIDGAGNSYYSTGIGVRKTAPGGVPANVAGWGSSSPVQEGAPAAGTKMQTTGLALSPRDELYFSDFLTRSVWRIDGQGAAHRVAGPVGADDTPSYLAFDPAGRLNILYDHGMGRIEADGSETPIALPVHAAAFAFDAHGALYITDYLSNRVSRWNPDGTLTTVAGSGQYGFSNGCGSGSNPGRGDALSARFEEITSMLFDAAGNLILVDTFHALVRVVKPSGEVSTLAGIAPGLGGDGGPAKLAQFAAPHGIAFDAAGNLFIADTGNNRVRKVTTDGIVQTVAGEGSPTIDLEYDCSAQADAFLRGPQSVAVDRAGNLFIADTGKHRVVKIASDGAFTIFAGTGAAGKAAAAIGAPANSQPLDSPVAVGVDRAGNVYIGDSQLRTLKVAPDGTIAGVIPGVRAQGFGTRANGDFYLIANWIGYRVTADDKLIPVAGTGQSSSILPATGPAPLDEPAVGNYPHRAGLTADASGTFWVMNYDSTLARIYPSGRVVQMFGNDMLPDGGYFVPQVGAADLAVNPGGLAHMADTFHNVIWRLPILPDSADAKPTPQLATAAVRNAASHQITTHDMILPTGGFSSAPYRFMENDVIAPGELIQITGEALGPQDGADITPNGNQSLPLTMAGVQVTLGDTPLPLLSVQAGRILAVTPATLPVNAALTLEVNVGGGRTRTTVRTAAAAPGWFTTPDADGGATIAATDVNGVPLSRDNPIAPGAVAALYGTGFGDGMPVQVSVNGAPAEVLYAGRVASYPGLGQINIVVPDTTSGVVELTIGGVHRAQAARLWIASGQ